MAMSIRHLCQNGLFLLRYFCSIPASAYDIRISDNPDTLRTNPEQTTFIGFTSRPKAAGEVESIQVTPNSTAEPKTYYVGVRAVDDNNNIGKMSNIISISVITDPKWQPSKFEEKDGLSQTLMFTIVGIAAALLVIIALACIVFMCKRKSKPKPAMSYDNRAYTTTESKY